MRILKVSVVVVMIFIIFIPQLPAQESIILQVYPYLSATELLRRFSPLAEYLSEIMQREVICNISKDYGEHIEIVGNDKVDIAYVGPTSYVEISRKYGQKNILARLEINGSPFYRGVIVVRKDSPLMSLQALDGKRFAFGDQHSTMGYIFPLFMLREAGIRKQNLSGHTFLNSDHNVAFGVLMGDFDAGAMKEEVFYQFRDRGLRALAWTPKISEHMFVARSSLPEGMVNRLRDALLTLKNEFILSSIRNGVTAFVPAHDSDYDNLRNTFNAMEQSDK